MIKSFEEYNFEDLGYEDLDKSTFYKDCISTNKKKDIFTKSEIQYFIDNEFIIKNVNHFSYDQWDWGNNAEDCLKLSPKIIVFLKTYFGSPIKKDLTIIKFYDEWFYVSLREDICRNCPNYIKTYYICDQFWGVQKLLEDKKLVKLDS